MDQLASQSIYALINYLVLSSTQDARKRVLPGGNNLTVTYTSPNNITVVADQNFFLVGDVGYVLALPNVPELKITTFTDATHVTCQTPSGQWLPGFSAPGSATVYASATIYYTSINTLASYFTQLNTYDTGGQTQTTEASNSRFVHQRIFLSATVTGSQWTVNQLGWSDGNGSHNVFGVANLAGADVIPVGKKYRVVLTVYSGYTPINLVGVAANWGPTIGNYTLDIRQEYLGNDLGSGGAESNFLQPHSAANYVRNWYATWWGTTHNLVASYWQGQSGGTVPGAVDYVPGTTLVSLGSYTAGQFTRTKNLRWPDTLTITNATALNCGDTGGGGYPILTLRPQSGTITKPSAYWCDVTFQIFWTRNLPT